MHRRITQSVYANTITKDTLLLKPHGGKPMIEQDTIRLMRECDAGIKMGVSAIDNALGYVQDGRFHNLLADSRNKHMDLDKELQSLLADYHDDGKAPNPLAKGMSWIKTNVMLTVNDSDATIADLITDGCNMGVKSLSKYLNQYTAADEKSKDITKKLIKIEEQLAVDTRSFL